MRKLYIIEGNGNCGGMPGSWWKYFTFPLTATQEEVEAWCREHHKGFTSARYLRDTDENGL